MNKIQYDVKKCIIYSKNIPFLNDKMKVTPLTLSIK